ncbi:MAG: endopeptidase La [Chlorobi bacterium]|nr:endopeptidase La [Chlorobiota bacterium]
MAEKKINEPIIPAPGNEDFFLNAEIPEELPLLPLRDTVLFPSVIMPIAVGRPKSVEAVKKAFEDQSYIGVVTQVKSDIEDPDFDDLFPVGTAARIIKLIQTGENEYNAIIQGVRRFKLEEIIQKEPYLKGKVTLLKDIYDHQNPELAARMLVIKDTLRELLELLPPKLSEALSAFIDTIDSPLLLINMIASHLDIPLQEKIRILSENDYVKKADLLVKQLIAQKQVLKIKQEIQEKVSSELEKQQRQFVLQQQLKSIQEELGMESGDPEIQRLKEKAEKKKLPEHVKKAFERELQRLRRMHPAMPEYSVILSYLELLLDLPWNEYSEDNYDLERARKILDRDHYDLNKVKRRILEHLAVLKLKKDMKAPILLFVGPPGVGKTSLGKSIAEALGRKFVRMSLGGLHDEAEIRGHRRTYIGAMPGRIIQLIRKAGTANPVFMLDEIDKIGRDFRGDPAAALLEVLDPEQNSHFYDNYLELEFDLSKVLFIATANTTATIHPALLDRMEVIYIGGYSTEQKIEIAKRHLLPKIIKEHGLDPSLIKLTTPALRYIIERYTRESGVRNLEKQLAAIVRFRAAQVARGEEFKPTITKKDIRKILGPEKFEMSLAEQIQTPGVSVGLAWTPFGGDILFVEVALYQGRGKLILTGSLGDVMRESATTALSWLRAHSEEFGIDPEVFYYWDVHLHVPEGAIPKDGPSAGIAILTALTSAFTQRKVKHNLAMTGEITLRGKVLPVGGIREKLLAAHRAGITDVILPEKNKKDLEELDEEEKKAIQELELHFVDNMKDVLKLALEKKPVEKPIDLKEPIRKLKEERRLFWMPPGHSN